jgi:hypothetical protein
MTINFQVSTLFASITVEGASVMSVCNNKYTANHSHIIFHNVTTIMKYKPGITISHRQSTN